MVYGYKEIIISLNGLQANYALTGNFYVMIVLPCIEILGCFLLLAGMRKVSSAILGASGSFVLLQTLLWLMHIRPIPFYYQIAYIETTGPYASLIGSSFVIFAALLSLLQLKLSS